MKRFLILTLYWAGFMPFATILVVLIGLTGWFLYMIAESLEFISSKIEVVAHFLSKILDLIQLKTSSLVDYVFDPTKRRSK